MKYYHGTQVQNIEQLKPFATRGNAISKPVICFTPNYCIALLYIWNRSYKWVTFSENENGNQRDIEHEYYGHGNIGVLYASQMQMMDIAKDYWNEYNHMADIFLREFCVRVY